MENIIKCKIFKFEDNINTDIIISGKYLRTEDTNIFKEHAFEVLRGDNFYKQINKGDVIFAKRNFGCGSSREQAALAVKELGVSMLIAKSFGRIFYRNIINLGLPAYILKENSQLDELIDKIEENDNITVFPDKGELVIESKNIHLEFYKITGIAKNIIEAGGLLNYAKKELSNNSM